MLHIIFHFLQIYYPRYVRLLTQIIIPTTTTPPTIKNHPEGSYSRHRRRLSHGHSSYLSHVDAHHHELSIQKRRQLSPNS